MLMLTRPECRVGLERTGQQSVGIVLLESQSWRVRGTGGQQGLCGRAACMRA